MKSPVANAAGPAYVKPVVAEREIASPPSVPAMVPPQAQACGGSFVKEKVVRAAFYVDGLNLYHAVDNLKRPYLKWLNIWSLGEHLIPSRSQTLVKVVYCTARKQRDPIPKTARQRELVTANEVYGVTTLWGHFNYGTMKCRGCNRDWPDPKEKESDVNLSLSVIDDAYQDVFDHAYLLTADSDQGATARVFKHRFPDKALTLVTPPGQERCKAVMGHTALHIAITVEHLERNLLPPLLIQKIGGVDTLRFRRPVEYAP